MRARPVLAALTLVLAAVVIQTTVFAPGMIQPFGAAPNVVLLTTIATARYLETEAALLVGFTAGFLVDLLGGAPLGLWAISLTVVAYVAIRLKPRAELGPLMIAAGVFGLTLLGQVVFVFVGTLFGQETVSDPQLIRKIILPAVYNVILAAPVFWVASKALHPSVRRWAT